MNNLKEIFILQKKKQFYHTLIPYCRRSDLNIPKSGETCTELSQSAS